MNIPKTIQTWFDLQSDIFKSNATIEQTNDIQLIRIDEDTPEVFIPRMPQTAMNSEDNTVARVCASTTLAGCISSVNKVVGDFYQWQVKGDKYKGGYLVSQLDSKYHVVPNKELVLDCETTDEKWLCAVDEEHREFKTIPIGKFFVYSILTKHTGKKTSTGYGGVKENEVTIYVEVFPNSKFKFSTDIEFNNDTNKSVYYCVKYIDKEFNSTNRYINQLKFNTPVINVTSIDKSEFKEYKELSAANLSIDTSSIISLHW